MGAWRRFTRFAGAAVLVVCACASAAAAAADPFPQNPRFENFGTEEGLPQDTVAALVQDHAGFLWLGTQDGLARYDGYRFEVYRADANDADALGDNLVRALHEDEAHRLWIGTGSGLFRLGADRVRFERLDAEEPAERGRGNRFINVIAGDAAGHVWVGTLDGLQRRDAASGALRIWHHVAGDAGSLPSDDVRALTFDENGRLWVGTAAGLVRLSPASGRLERFEISAGGASAGPRNTINSLRWVGPDTLWVGTKAGLVAWSFAADDAAPAERGPADALPTDDVRAIGLDRDGAIWAGTVRDGAYRIDRTTLAATRYTHRPQDPHTIASGGVVSVLHDRSGTLWLGTWTGGMSRLDLASGGFERYLSIAGDPTSLSDPRVYDIAPDARGGLWLATKGGGLDYLDASMRRVRNYRHDANDPTSLPDNRVAAVATDRAGRVWVATDRGFGRLDPDSGRFHALHAPTSGSEAPSSILVDRAGRVWFGTDTGLHRHDPVSGSLESFTHDPQREASIALGVRQLFEDSRGTLWIGTATALDRFDAATGTFVHFRHDPARADSLASSRVSDVHEDAQGALWIGTAGGLHRMELRPDGTASFRRYTRRDGLASDPVGAIASDASGRLWFSTTVGISRLDPATGAVRNYPVRDGLIAGGFYIHSGDIAPDGTIRFGGLGGMVAFHPEAIRENGIAPEVAITELRIGGRAVRGTRLPNGVAFDGQIEHAPELRFAHDVPDFTLEFAALHFADPTRNRYAHQLVGYDRDWIETDATQRTATYTNLDPGDYVFRVKASNKDGVWNETGITLPVRVLPPWWGTWWFRVAALALVAAAVVGAHRLRVRVLTARSTWLANEVEGRTQEVVRQKEQLELVARDVSTLAEIGREITATLDERAVCRTLDRHVHALLDADGFVVYLLDAHRSRLVSIWWVEQGAIIPDVDRIDVDSPTRIGARCLRERQELLVDIDPEVHDPSHVPGTLRSLSALFAPLAIGPRVLGLMTIQSARSRAYGERERQIFRTLCAYGAIALDNASAYRRLAESDAALSRTLREQDLIFDNVATAIYFVRNRTIQRCNRGFEDMLGYGPGELIGRSTEVFYLSREAWEARGRAVYPLITAGQVAEGEQEARRKDGRVIWMAYRGRALDPADPEQGTIWVAQDVTERKRTAAALERTLKEQQTLFDNELGAIMFVKDRVVARCNRGVELFLGYAPGELIGMSTREYYATEEEWHAFAAREMPVLAAGRIARGDVRYKRKDGKLIWVSYTGKAIDPANLAEGVIWVGQEITERKEAEFLLHEGKQKLETALAEVERTHGQLSLLSELTGFLQACPDAHEAHACIAEYGPRLFPRGLGALYLIGADGTRLDESARWGEWPPGSAGGFAGADCWALRRGQPYRMDRPGTAPCCAHVAARGGAQRPYACVPLVAQGRTFGLLFVEHGDGESSATVHPAHGLVVALAEQVGLALANIRLREQLTQQSIRDPLTGLYNRRHMHDVLARELGRCRRDGTPLTVAMIDVDHFKKFNDTFGHHAGDVVLQGVARLLEARFREVDVACRFGGEEFIVLMPGCPVERALERAQELLDAIRALRLVHESRALDHVTASLGLAQFPLHADHAGPLVETADAALYRAKVAGRDRVFVAERGVEA